MQTNTNTNANYQIVYKMSIAMELIKKGHKVISTMTNPKNQKLTVWIFERDTSFQSDFDNLMRKE